MGTRHRLGWIERPGRSVRRLHDVSMTGTADSREAFPPASGCIAAEAASLLRSNDWLGHRWRGHRAGDVLKALQAFPDGWNVRSSGELAVASLTIPRRIFCDAVTERSPLAPPRIRT